MEKYCSSSSNVLHFSYSYAAKQRYANTVSFSNSRAPYMYVRFDIVVDCGQKAFPSSSAYVTLQYSTNAGTNWNLLDKGCSPSTTNCGVYRYLN